MVAERSLAGNINPLQPLLIIFIDRDLNTLLTIIKPILCTYTQMIGIEHQHSCVTEAGLLDIIF